MEKIANNIGLFLVLLFAVSCDTNIKEEQWNNITQNYFSPIQDGHGIEVFKMVQTKPDSLIAYYVAIPPNQIDYSVEFLLFDTLTSISAYMDNSAKKVLVAVNGGYFSYGEEWPTGILVHDKQEKAHTVTSVKRNKKDYYLTRGAFAIDTIGNPFIGWVFYLDSMSYWYDKPLANNIDTDPLPKPAKGKTLPVEEAIGAGPILIMNNKIIKDYSSEFFSKKNFTDIPHPRTAIGNTKNGTIILMIVEGRRKESVGVTCNELANMMSEVGCINAMNLDGGGSSYGYVNGKPLNRSSDCYSENLDLGQSLKKEREISTIISVVKK